MSIGENLKRIRTEKGISQEELADAVQVSQPMIAQIERGTKGLTLGLAKDILKVLEVSIDEVWND